MAPTYDPSRMIGSNPGGVEVDRGVVRHVVLHRRGIAEPAVWTHRAHAAVGGGGGGDGERVVVRLGGERRARSPRREREEEREEERSSRRHRVARAPLARSPPTPTTASFPRRAFPSLVTRDAAGRISKKGIHLHASGHTPPRGPSAVLPRTPTATECTSLSPDVVDLRRHGRDALLERADQKAERRIKSQSEETYGADVVPAREREAAEKAAAEAKEAAHKEYIAKATARPKLGKVSSEWKTIAVRQVRPPRGPRAI